MSGPPPRDRNGFKIWQEARRRGISKLYHFTPAGNVRSILLYGLHSRQTLLAHDVDFYVTDPHRFDERLDGVSLSVHSINEAMFEAKNRDYRGQLVVLELDASLLWTHSCRFCWTNAAAKEIRDHRGHLGGPWAFSRMFEDRPVSLLDTRPARSAFQRPDCQPTDSQAEVQVLDPVSPDAIIDITAGSRMVKDELEAVMAEIGVERPVVLYEELFRLGL
jgi:hypothetical protein